jgi:hypothetical protein
MSDWGSPDINTPNIDNQYSLYGADNGHLPTPATNEANILYYIPKAECGPDGAVPVVSPRKAAVETLVENSNFSQWFCEAV